MNFVISGQRNRAPEVALGTSHEEDSAGSTVPSRRRNIIQEVAPSIGQEDDFPGSPVPSGSRSRPPARSTLPAVSVRGRGRNARAPRVDIADIDSDRYDPAEPINDEAGNESLKSFLQSQIRELKETLQSQAKHDGEVLRKNLSQHLCFMEEKITEKNTRPQLKSKFNIKHYDRVQRYKIFLKDAKYSFENGNTEDAVGYIDSCIEAIDKYQKDIILADNSVCGWELVEKLTEGPIDRDILAVERKIIEDRKSRKRPRNEATYDEATYDEAY